MLKLLHDITKYRNAHGNYCAECYCGWTCTRDTLAGRDAEIVKHIRKFEKAIGLR